MTNKPPKSFILTTLRLSMLPIGMIVAFTAWADEPRVPACATSVNESNWGAWRGPWSTGVAPNADPPVEWSGARNIRWKVAVPGRGHSTPIVWGDHVLLTTAEPYGEKLAPRYSQAPGTHDGIPVRQHHQFTVLALSRIDGHTIWQQTVFKALPHEGGHYTASLASNSIATDGKHVFAFFGSYGLYCLTMMGDIVWTKSFGQMQTLHGHGEASSPVVFGDHLAVNWDHEGASFVVVLAKDSGKEMWRARRDEPTSWSSPIVVEHRGRAQLVVSGTKRVRGYNLATGNVIWECGGLSSNVVASPVSASGMVFVGSSYEKKAMFAILLEGANGDITGTNQIAWSRNRGTPYVPSPLLYGDSLYFLSHYQGVLNRVDERTGINQFDPIRLSTLTDIYASPVAANGRVYITDREGQTAVLDHSNGSKIVAVNKLDDVVNASAALVGRELFLRGEKYLYCISDQE